MENKPVKVNFRISLVVSALVGLFVLLGIVFNPAFLIPAAFVISCFGRFLFTGACPAMNVIGKIRRLVPGRR